MFFGAPGAIYDIVARRLRLHLRCCDPIVRLVVTHWILGALTGVGCAGFLLVCDVAGLRSLLFHSDVAVAGLALLFGGFAITFGGVVSATAVMMVTPEEEPMP
ncbi:MAG: hypothetical protein ACLQIQ_17865 [Beijerinckiaceae bacterium]